MTASAAGAVELSAAGSVVGTTTSAGVSVTGSDIMNDVEEESVEESLLVKFLQR